MSGFFLLLYFVFNRRLLDRSLLGRLFSVSSWGRSSGSRLILLNWNFFFNSVIFNKLSFFKINKTILIKLDLNLNSKFGFFWFARSNNKVG